VSESEVQTALRILDEAIDEAANHPTEVAAAAAAVGAMSEVEAGT
jgi:hypothetical protein